MFNHIFMYRIKVLLHSREYIFWSLLFPIVLGTFFYLAFSNLDSDENFTQIPIAVVEADESDAALFLREGIEGVSSVMSKEELSDTDSNSNMDEDYLFRTVFTDQKTADKMLLEQQIEGYFILGEEPQMVVTESDYAQAIMKAFLDIALQKLSTVTNIMTETNGQADAASILQLSSQEYLEIVKVSEESPNSIVLYFYTLLAMTCMYGNIAGIAEMNDIQSNQSEVAKRTAMSKVSKFRRFFPSVCASIVIQVGLSLILIAFLMLILKVDVGEHLLLVILTSVLGNIVGIAFGACIGCMSKLKVNAKIGLGMGLTMLGCFLAGMMNAEVKYEVQKNFPLAGKLNPVNLLTDAYYSLYYYDTFDRYIENIFFLMLWCLGMLAVVFWTLRRLEYDSL